MIRSLRIRHRRVFTALALLLPATLVAGLWHRPSFPLVPGAPLPAGSSQVLDFGALQVDVTRDGSHLLLRPRQDPRAPDVAVIWSAGSREEGTLLGTLAGVQPRTVDLPGRGGRLFLYSLGHDELLGSAELPWD